MTQRLSVTKAVLSFSLSLAIASCGPSLEEQQQTREAERLQMLVAFHLRRLRDRESDTGYDTPRGSSDGALAVVSQTAVYDTC